MLFYVDGVNFHFNYGKLLNFEFFFSFFFINNVLLASKICSPFPARVTILHERVVLITIIVPTGYRLEIESKTVSISRSIDYLTFGFAPSLRPKSKKFPCQIRRQFWFDAVTPLRVT